MKTARSSSGNSQSSAMPETFRRDLSKFDNSDFDHGRGWLTRTLWYFLSLACFESGLLPLSAPKRFFLRLFGARIGKAVVIKPNVRIKYPWRLSIGDHSWIGQETWIDNLAYVTVGDHVCISQGVYFCTGSHDYRCSSFDLVTGKIEVLDGAWIGARATLLGGVSVGQSAVVAAGSVVTRNVQKWTLVGGVPAENIQDEVVSHGERELS